MSRTKPLSHGRFMPGIAIVIVALCLSFTNQRPAIASGGAGTLVVTSNMIIDDGDATYEGYDIIVRGATLTINGVHEFNSLTVERNDSNQPGVVTHDIGFVNDQVSGAWLIVQGDVFVEGSQKDLVASAISLDARGFAAAAGPGAGTSGGIAGGAGHGGIGGPHSGDTGTGPAYGSPTEPVSLGSGGGNDTTCCGGAAAGGRGGGALRLIVGGTLTIDGSITAHGANGAGAQAGGGAGGSIWITAEAVEGNGTIGADGGLGAGGASSFGGGGAGGRIALVASSSAFSDANVRAAGGQSGSDPERLFGAAGTVWIDDGNHSMPRLILDNAGGFGELTALAGVHKFPAHLFVRGAARFGPAVGDDSFDVRFDGDAHVEAGAEITATGRGFAAASGPAPGVSAALGGGGGHGGIGGPGSDSTAGGGQYGSVTMPTLMGSGGGNDTTCCGGAAAGGRGGGALRLIVVGTLTVDGSIEADGHPGTGSQAGGGAGGSIWIDCGALAGGGTITARGGAGAGSETSFGGGGAGGRIAIMAATASMLDTQLRAVGGASGADPLRLHGAAGTVWIDDAGATRALLIVDNGDNFGEWTALSGVHAFDADLIVRAAGRFGPAVGDATMATFFTGDGVVELGGEITATGRGFGGGVGPGAGLSAATAGGGGHGGAGAASSGSVGGGQPYGSFDAPVTLGSGGGNDTTCCGSSALGGRGGGAVRISFGGILTVDGSIEADGRPGTGFQAGGGAGGSLWITASGVFGAGSITADGGPGAGSSSSHGGGGAGGRIAIYSCAVDLPEGSIRAAGGQSGLSDSFGQDGTVGFFSDTVDFLEPPTSVAVDPGETAQLAVVATGDGIFAYQWYFNGSALEDGDDFSGATTDMLTIFNVQCGVNTGAYRVAVFDACGFSFSPDAIVTALIFADLNNDCTVDGADLGLLLSSWGPCDGCPADLNGDGFVNGADLGLLLSVWGS